MKTHYDHLPNNSASATTNWLNESSGQVPINMIQIDFSKSGGMITFDRSCRPSGEALKADDGTLRTSLSSWSNSDEIRRPCSSHSRRSRSRDHKKPEHRRSPKQHSSNENESSFRSTKTGEKIQRTEEGHAMDQMRGKQDVPYSITEEQYGYDGLPPQEPSQPQANWKEVDTPTKHYRHSMLVRDISASGKLATRVTKTTPAPIALQESGHSSSRPSLLHVHPSMTHLTARAHSKSRHQSSKRSTESLRPHPSMQHFMPTLQPLSRPKSTSMLDTYNLSEHSKPRKQSASYKMQRHRSQSQMANNCTPETHRQCISRDSQRQLSSCLTPNTISLPVRHALESSTRSGSPSTRCQAAILADRLQHARESSVRSGSPSRQCQAATMTDLQPGSQEQPSLGPNLFKKAIFMAARAVSMNPNTPKRRVDPFDQSRAPASERLDIPHVIEFIQFDPEEELRQERESCLRDRHCNRRGFVAKGA